jgi:hypothetical protein
MPPRHDYPQVFRRLRAILESYAPEMRVTNDTESAYSLDTHHTMANGQPLFFGSVQVRKNYVSFYVMPVYAFPDLLDGIGDLRKRMQGKSCFNFRTLDDEQVAAMEDLVRRGHARYAAEGMLA